MSSAIVPTYSKKYSGFDPRQIPGCYLWLDAADTSSITQSGGTISQWSDKSGNGRNATQATVARQPTYSDTAVTFTTANQQYLSLPNAGLWTSNSPLSIYIVIAPTSTYSLNVFMFQGLVNSGTQRALGMYSTGAVWADYWQNATPLTQIQWGTPQVNVKALISYVYVQNTTLTAYSNGAGAVSRGATAYTVETGNATIGAEVERSFYSSVKMYEFIVYNTTSTTEQRRQIEGYLAWKWGLRSNLPLVSGDVHPYRSIPLYTQQFSPPDIARCQLWLDAADASTITLSGTTVTQWRDKSGNSNNPSLFASPTYSTGGTYPYVATRGGTQYLTIPATAYTTSATTTPMGYLFFVYADTQTQVASNNAMLFGTSTPFDYFNQSLQRSDSQSYWISSTNTPVSITSVLNTTNIIIYCLQYQHGSTSFLMRINGSTMSLTVSTSAMVPTGALTISGAGWGPAGTTSNLNLCEIISFSATTAASLSLSDIQRVEGYLAWKWKRLSVIPAAHSFKLYQPLNTLFNPLQIANCAVWLDAADTTTITGTNPVTAWVNKGTLRGTVVNRTGSCTSGNVLNTLNYINCPSGTDMEIPLTINTQARSYFFVSRKSVALASGQSFFVVGSVLGAGGECTVSFTYTTATTYTVSMIAQGVGTRIASAVTSSTTASPYVMAIVNSATVASNRVTLNGTVQTLGTSVAASSYKTVSASYTASRAGNSQSVDIMEIIIYYGDLIDSERRRVEGYLANKWGIQNTLPTTHPYYKSSP